MHLQRMACFWCVSIVVATAGCSQSVAPTQGDPGVTVGDVKGPDALRLGNDAFSPQPRGDGWPGLAVFDFDNDGDIDIFAGMTEGIANLVYRNDGSGNFDYVGRETGLIIEEHSIVAAAVGDFDNDGWLDLICARQAPFLRLAAASNDLLFMKNMGVGSNGLPRFEDRTTEAGLSGIAYATGIGVGDIDNDGLLDLYVGRYNLRDLGFPQGSYLPDTPSVLLRSTGVVDGVPVFEDITAAAGVAGETTFGLAPDSADFEYHVPTWTIYFSDVNEDGYQDIFSLQEIPGVVELYINNGDLTFTQAHRDLLGKRGGWMGMTAADFDHNGHIDYFVANVGADAKGTGNQTNISNAWSRDDGSPYHFLLSNLGEGMLVDVAADTRVTPGPFPPDNILNGRGLAAYEFGFGCAFFDMQNDGWPDLHWIGEIVLSGFLPDGPIRRDFHGVGRYMRNNGDGSFTDRTGERGLFNWPDDEPLAYGYNHAGRALAAIDLTGDGFADLCRTNTFFVPSLENAPQVFECLINPAVEGGHWLIIRLTGNESNRFGIGARVTTTCGELTHVAEVVTTTSAFTAVHPQAHFGLGDCTTIERLSIRWPSGIVTELADVDVDQVLTVEEVASELPDAVSDSTDVSPDPPVDAPSEMP